MTLPPPAASCPSATPSPGPCSRPWPARSTPASTTTARSGSGCASAAARQAHEPVAPGRAHRSRGRRGAGRTGTRTPRARGTRGRRGDGRPGGRGRAADASADAGRRPPARSSRLSVDRSAPASCSSSCRAPPEGDPRAPASRATRWSRQHLPLVEHLARRFRNRGEPYDDLVQVATIGLIKSVDRFDLERGVEFSTYATPTIVGEIKRHFRDKGWAVRVPRRLQELRLSLASATSELSQKQRPGADRARARRPPQDQRRGGARGPRVGERLQHPLAGRRRLGQRRRADAGVRDPRRRGRGARGRGVPRVAQADARAAARPREEDPACCGSSRT